MHGLASSRFHSKTLRSSVPIPIEWDELEQALSGQYPETTQYQHRFSIWGGGGGKEVNITIKLDTVFTDPTNSLGTKFTKPTLGRQTGKGHQKKFRQKALPMETSP
jgi:hypothetical protein